MVSVSSKSLLRRDALKACLELTAGDASYGGRVAADFWCLDLGCKYKDAQGCIQNV